MDQKGKRWRIDPVEDRRGQLGAQVRVEANRHPTQAPRDQRGHDLAEVGHLLLGGLRRSVPVSRGAQVGLDLPGHHHPRQVAPARPADLELSPRLAAEALEPGPIGPPSGRDRSGERLIGGRGQRESFGVRRLLTLQLPLLGLAPGLTPHETMMLHLGTGLGAHWLRPAQVSAARAWKRRREG